MAEMVFPAHWSDHEPSFRMDILALILALALHAPLYYMRFDVRKQSMDHKASRLVAIDLIDEEALKKEPIPPPPPPVVDKSSFMEKLKALVRKEPPPPVPVKKEVPKELATGPKPIQLEAKLKEAEKIQPALQTKSGFKTQADPNLVTQAQLKLKGDAAALAPLSASKLGATKPSNPLEETAPKSPTRRPRPSRSAPGGGKWSNFQRRLLRWRTRDDWATFKWGSSGKRKNWDFGTRLSPGTRRRP
jgi:hypothetical protein